MSDGADNAESTAGTKSIHATPTKDFFLTVVTKDISIQDCIFDLIDNSIDAAHKSSAQSGRPLSDYNCTIRFSDVEFLITDNCGGISLSDAIDYAFHFGRSGEQKPSDIESIGLYGIGMKRAIFRIGKYSIVSSETPNDSFDVVIDVEAWMEDEDNWDFYYKDKPRSGGIGTTISISELYEGPASTFKDPTFLTETIKSIARDYAFFIYDGFSIQVLDRQVPAYKYELRRGGEIAPASIEYDDDEVHVRLLAGIAEELEDEIPEDLRQSKVEKFGWFIICNGRVVLAGDKTSDTVWGDDNFQVWHPQYNGFAGYAFFTSKNPRKLPWTSTKRQLDATNPLYRRALGHMKEMTEDFIAYTSRRKADPEAARLQERSAQAVSIREEFPIQRMSLPAITSALRTRQDVTISYSKPKAQVKEIAESLGNSGMSAREVGKATFEYYRAAELGK